MIKKNPLVAEVIIEMHQNNDRLAGFKIKTKGEVAVLHNKAIIPINQKKSNELGTGISYFFFYPSYSSLDHKGSVLQ